jgi:hypothetical protein
MVCFVMDSKEKVCVSAIPERCLGRQAHQREQRKITRENRYKETSSAFAAFIRSSPSVVYVDIARGISSYSPLTEHHVQRKYVSIMPPWCVKKHTDSRHRVRALDVSVVYHLHGGSSWRICPLVLPCQVRHIRRHSHSSRRQDLA